MHANHLLFPSRFYYWREPGIDNASSLSTGNPSRAHSSNMFICRISQNPGSEFKVIEMDAVSFSRTLNWLPLLSHISVTRKLGAIKAQSWQRFWCSLCMEGSRVNAFLQPGMHACDSLQFPYSTILCNRQKHPFKVRSSSKRLEDTDFSNRTKFLVVLY